MFHLDLPHPSWTDRPQPQLRSSLIKRKSSHRHCAYGKMLLLQCMSRFLADFVAEVAEERSRLRLAPSTARNQVEIAAPF
jgi:hypothetical protein